MKNFIKKFKIQLISCIHWKVGPEILCKSKFCYFFRKFDLLEKEECHGH